MAIFRCNKCSLLQEQPERSVGTSLPCPKCGNPVDVYPTVFFVGKLLNKYFDSQREVARLRAATPGAAGSSAALPTLATPFDALDLANTDQLASDAQHRPIRDWFEAKLIGVQFNPRGVDTTGFFDEIAVALGENLPVLREVVDRIRWAQQKEFATTTIHLERKSEPQARDIAAFCQRLYDYSFVAKCFHNREQNNIRLIVQTAPAIRNFFAGEWLEWYALMTCLEYARQHKTALSCARNLAITLPNGDSYELDVFLLIDGKKAICIECKTGEFRHDIDKYLTLRKALGIPGRNFIMCVAGLSEEHARGLTTMYGLSFTNELGLTAQLAKLL
jgi:hypothetical protein